MRLFQQLAFLLCFAIPALGAISGCGSPYALHPVTGTITFDGEPLEGATVNFTPNQGGKPAMARTDANGKYQLMDSRPEALLGAEAGEYIVTVTWTPPLAVDTTQMTGSSANYDPKAAQKNDSKKPVRGKVPVAYANPSLSGLAAKVDKTSTVHDFDLKSNYKGKN